jgi:hypothetical protein
MPKRQTTLSFGNPCKVGNLRNGCDRGDFKGPRGRPYGCTGPAHRSSVRDMELLITPWHWTVVFRGCEVYVTGLLILDSRIQ